MLAVYFKDWSKTSYMTRTPPLSYLKPTGRWKLTWGPYDGSPHMYIEHKEGNEKEWVHEDNVVIADARREYIHDVS